MLSIWNINTYVCTDKWLSTADSDWQTTDLSSEKAPHKKHDSNRQTVTNIWSWEPEGARRQDITTGWLTYQLTISHNVTLTLDQFSYWIESSSYDDYRIIGILEIWSWFIVEFTVRQELLWLRHGHSSGTQRKGNVHHWKLLPECWWRHSRLRRLSVWCNELKSVQNGDSAIVNCNYKLKVSNKSGYQSKPLQ
jgi:hypothetical protein